MAENSLTKNKDPFLRYLWARASKNAFLEKPFPADDLDQAMRNAARPMLAFYLMLALATTEEELQPEDCLRVHRLGFPTCHRSGRHRTQTSPSIQVRAVFLALVFTCTPARRKGG